MLLLREAGPGWTVREGTVRRTRPGRQFAQMGETEYAASFRQERGRLGRFGCGPEARAPGPRSRPALPARAPRLTPAPRLLPGSFSDPHSGPAFAFAFAFLVPSS